MSAWLFVVVAVALFAVFTWTLSKFLYRILDAYRRLLDERNADCRSENDELKKERAALQEHIELLQAELTETKKLNAILQTLDEAEYIKAKQAKKFEDAKRLEQEEADERAEKERERQEKVKERERRRNGNG